MLTIPPKLTPNIVSALRWEPPPILKLRLLSLAYPCGSFRQFPQHVIVRQRPLTARAIHQYSRAHVAERHWALVEPQRPQLLHGLSRSERHIKGQVLTVVSHQLDDRPHPIHVAGMHRLLKRNLDLELLQSLAYLTLLPAASQYDGAHFIEFRILPTVHELPCLC
jgi:hypothetical protein